MVLTIMMTCWWTVAPLPLVIFCFEHFEANTLSQRIYTTKLLPGHQHAVYSGQWELSTKACCRQRPQVCTLYKHANMQICTLYKHAKMHLVVQICILTVAHNLYLVQFAPGTLVAQICTWYTWYTNICTLYTWYIKMYISVFIFSFDPQKCTYYCITYNVYHHLTHGTRRPCKWMGRHRKLQDHLLQLFCTQRLVCWTKSW